MTTRILAIALVSVLFVPQVLRFAAYSVAARDEGLLRAVGLTRAACWLIAAVGIDLEIWTRDWVFGAIGATAIVANVAAALALRRVSNTLRCLRPSRRPSSGTCDRAGRAR